MRQAGRARVTLFILAVIVGAILWMRPQVPRAGGPIAADVYIWQRAWSDPVRQAVAARGPQFSRLVFLAAQAGGGEKGPAIFRVPLDFPALKQLQRPVGLAIRVTSVRGPLTPERGQAIAELAAALLAEAQAKGVPIAELQIDFDAAESQLEQYRAWVEAIRGRCGDTPVTMTALPSWLDAPGFAKLAQATAGYVLQVHSFETPSFKTSLTLCDPARARAAVERAGRIGVPFRVALPTYSYLAAFDEKGKFAGVSAEGQNIPQVDPSRLRLVRANAAELAQLVSAWTADRPAAMQGIIWYRLPVEGDMLNWRWPTLAAVMAGRVPTSSLQLAFRREADQLTTIELKNTGEADEILAPVAASAAGDSILGADGLEGFAAYWDARQARFVPHGTQLLGAGDTRVIGWIRTRGASEVTAHVEK